MYTGPLCSTTVQWNSCLQYTFGTGFYKNSCTNNVRCISSRCGIHVYTYDWNTLCLDLLPLSLAKGSISLSAWLHIILYHSIEFNRGLSMAGPLGAACSSALAVLCMHISEILGMREFEVNLRGGKSLCSPNPLKKSLTLGICFPVS